MVAMSIRRRRWSRYLDHSADELEVDILERGAVNLERVEIDLIRDGPCGERVKRGGKIDYVKREAVRDVSNKTELDGGHDPGASRQYQPGALGVSTRQCLRCSLRNKFTGGDNRHTIREILSLIHVMRCQQNCLT